VVTSAPWHNMSIFDIVLPPHGGCVSVGGLPDGVIRARATWSYEFDPSVPLMMSSGLFLLLFWEPLRESTTLHASLGGVFSIIVLVVFLAWFVLSQTRKLVHGAVPFGATLTSLSMSAFVFFPSARTAMLAYAGSWGGEWSSWLFFTIVAVLVIVALVTVNWGARQSLAYFAMPMDPEGDVPFTIGANGARVDDLPPRPWSQRLLGFVLWGSGVLLVLSSTHVDALSAVILVLVLSADTLMHGLWLNWIRVASTRPESLRPLMPRIAFERQGQECTEAAVRQLRATLQRDPMLFRSVKEQSELRLRRFSEGCAHAELPPDALRGPPSWSCAVL